MPPSVPPEPNLPEAVRVLRRAREQTFLGGVALLALAFVGVFAALTLPAKRFAPVYNQAWLREHFEWAATPAEKDRAVFTLLDVVATTEHYYLVGALLLVAVTLLASLFLFGLYRYLSLVARHLADRV